MSVTVRRALTRDAGGCNACEVSAAHLGAEVLVIRLANGFGPGGTEVRLCDSCAAELRTGIREARPQ